ncbi:hypothetical protein N7509_012543 [Penicillium cosmopolitanum]|uniref:Uncharacterized protein n=1 Tax=Penicillium cosmopolitanum TaxID=1131564 RepID=A0A9W9SKJ5_9EURO|nr:uncharacterized protein N7509_012543 [Penicillium cosmopolitanum]KAJ5379424.1 hypothetical protein N7509_012543 [Penicillium cosmopolitanum]
MPKSLAWYTFMAYDGELPIPLQTRTYLRIYLDDPRFKALVQNQTSKLTCKFIEVALQTTSRDPKSPSWFAALVLNIPVYWFIIDDSNDKSEDNSEENLKEKPKDKSKP